MRILEPSGRDYCAVLRCSYFRVSRSLLLSVPYIELLHTVYVLGRTINNHVLIDRYLILTTLKEGSRTVATRSCPPHMRRQISLPGRHRTKDDVHSHASHVDSCAKNRLREMRLQANILPHAGSCITVPWFVAAQNCESLHWRVTQHHAKGV
jgi:hypothetical protein